MFTSSYKSFTSSFDNGLIIDTYAQTLIFNSHPQNGSRFLPTLFSHPLCFYHQSRSVVFFFVAVLFSLQLESILLSSTTLLFVRSWFPVCMYPRIGITLEYGYGTTSFFRQGALESLAVQYLYPSRILGHACSYRNREYTTLINDCGTLRDGYPN